MSKAGILIKKAAKAALRMALLCAGVSLSGCAAAPKGSHVTASVSSAWQNSGIQNIFTDFAEFDSETEAAAEAFYAEASERYEACVPSIEEALLAYREDRDFKVDYAAYDRYFYFDSFSLPEGTIAILSRDNICMGFRMNLRCREDFDGGIISSTSSDREILCEYYEIGDVRYFSYVDSDLADTSFSIPNFMCMTDMEQIYAVDKEKESWTVYRNEFNRFGEQGFFWEAEATGLLREYIEMSGSLYRIDREHKALFPVSAPERTLPSGTPALADYVYRSWLYKQKELCQNLLYKVAVSAEDVEAVLPDGYILRWSDDYTVSDLNGDGILDILALICPVLERYDYEGRSYYGEDSPYLKVPEYYYLELWLFAGQLDGSFLGECLMDSDLLVWDDTFSLTDITGFSGGFFMEYFVGRSPFETVLFKFVYDSGEWKLVGRYGNDSYSTPTSFYAYTEDILAAEELYKVSVRDYVNEQYAALLSESGYTDYGSLFRLPDEALVQRINEALLGEMDKLFGAMEALDECHDVLLQNDFIFLNSRVAVLEFKFMDKTADGVSVDRYLPVSIDLATGEIIDFRDYITAEELGKLLVCTNPDCKTEENLALFDLYDDYETLLKVGGDSMTLLLVHEGLLILNADKYWPDCCLIPRCRLLDSPLAVFWDDWQ